jgi:periplasmic divalent cation tolerance protein
MTDVVIVLTTLPATDAERVARVLVEDRLAACVNILPPMSSTYLWRGEVVTETEQQLVAKTVRGQVTRIRERLAGIHPYELPEFLVLDVAEGGDAYLTWVRESTKL